MPGARRGWRRSLILRAAAAASAVALVGSACSSSKPKPAVQATGILSFDRPVAFNANGLLPGPDPTRVCGSATEAFLSGFSGDLTSITKIPLEWADVVKGRQVYVAGTLGSVELSEDDFLFAHPFGFDFTGDLTVDPLYQQLLVTNPVGSQQSASTLHFEIEQGMLPHQGSGLQDFLDGWLPQDGDRVAAIGRWIIDCGHADFHTEMHPPTFLAFAHPDGSATTAHVLYNPWHVTQLYNPDDALAGQLADAARLADPHTKPFPNYAIDQVLRLGHRGPNPPPCCADRLTTHVLMEANTLSPVKWVVCAPVPKPDGATVSWSGQLTHRTGVSVAATTYDDQGCVGFTATLGPDYAPAGPAGRSDCPWSWQELNAEAATAANAKDLDVEKLLESQVPAKYRRDARKPPTYDCYPPVQAAPPAGRPSTGGGTIDDAQPYPFYGTITVSWTGEA